MSFAHVVKFTKMFTHIVMWITCTTLAVRFRMKGIPSSNSNLFEISKILSSSSSSLCSSSALQSASDNTAWNDGSVLGTTEDGTVFAIGNTQNIPADHPVIQKVLERWKEDSKPGRRSLGDTDKIALSIEGGGMRGCVSAGATAALHYLGLNDAVDVVYGSSAGAMVAAYFISRQFAGVQIYHGKL